MGVPFYWYGLTSIQTCNGVRPNDWETRPPPGNYSTANDTWIQASTNMMPAPDYGTHGGIATVVIVTSKWVHYGHGGHGDPIIRGIGKPSAFPC